MIFIFERTSAEAQSESECPFPPPSFSASDIKVWQSLEIKLDEISFNEVKSVIVPIEEAPKATQFLKDKIANLKSCKTKYKRQIKKVIAVEFCVC